MSLNSEVNLGEVAFPHRRPLGKQTLYQSQWSDQPPIRSSAGYAAKR
jgi:hypothetical protein